MDHLRILVLRPLERKGPAQGRKKVRFKNKLVSLDSTVIDLFATLFDWAKFQRTKGAVKLHCLLDHDGYLPSVVVITEGKRHVPSKSHDPPGDRGNLDSSGFSYTLSPDPVN
jgi:hypothetical protein